MYQMLDDGFVGVIISCFNKDTSDTSGRIQITAFQSAEQITIVNNSPNTLEENSLSKNSDRFSDSHNLRNSDLHSSSLLSVRSEQLETGNRVERIEIPLQIVSSPINGPNTLERIFYMQQIFFNEEREAYLKANKISNQTNATDMHSVDLLSQLHSASVFLKSICRLLELQTKPALIELEHRKNQNMEKITYLKALKQKLEEQ